MGVKDSFVRFSEHAVRRLYAGPLKRTMLLFGAEPTLETIYKSAVSELVPSEISITASDTTLQFCIDDIEEYRMFQNYPETRESYPVLASLIADIEPTDVVWDVGANVGIYTCFSATETQEGTAVGVEPNPTNAARIEDNLNRNGLSASVHQLALAETSGELVLDVSKTDTAGAYGSITDDSRGGIQVSVTTGDRLVERGVPEPNVMKVDVEGAEFGVLKGMEESISRNECRVIYCDVQGTAANFPTIEKRISGWLGERGFDVEPMWEWTYEDQKGRYIRAERV